MDLQSYLKLTHLLENDDSQKEERRAFFLKHQMQKFSKIKQLLFWMQNASHTAMQKNLHLKSITGVLFFISFIVGLVSAAALLSYSGAEPVNVIYFFTIAVIVPLLSMLFSLFALFFPRYFTPLFLSAWAEKLLLKLFSGDTPFLKIDKDLKYAFTLFVVQLSALLFSTGIFLGFLGIVFTHDIAFGWSTTLNITPESFYSFLHTLSLPFAQICPQSLISLELIEKSHYFRLGHTMSKEMAQSASLFGEWWRFLACSTLFYAIVLRLISLLFSFIKYKRALHNAILNIQGAQTLLRDMNEVLISTNAQTKEPKSEQKSNSINITTQKHMDYYAVLGWAFDHEELLVTVDTLGLPAQNIHILGGNQSLKEESTTISRMQGDILLLIKAWEVPTMEFIDTLEELAHKADTVTLYPIGYAKAHYRANPQDLTIWEQKIAAQNLKNVSIQL